MPNLSQPIIRAKESTNARTRGLEVAIIWVMHEELIYRAFAKKHLI